MIADHAIDWKRKIRPYNIWDLNLFHLSLNEGGAVNFATKALQGANGAGFPAAAADFYAQVIKSGASAIGLGIRAAATLAAANRPVASFVVPDDLDPKWPVGFRILWTSAGASGSATYLIEMMTHKSTAAIPAANDAGFAALDTVIGASTHNGADKLNVSGRGLKLKLGLSSRDIDDVSFINLRFDLSAVTTVTAANTVLIGLLMDYVPKLCIGQGSHTDRPIRSDGTK